MPLRKVVLGLNGGPTDELVVRLGCQLTKPVSAELVAVHVIEVDWRHELSEEMTEENLAASTVLDMAEGIAERYKVKLTGDLLQAREVAAALVDGRSSWAPTRSSSGCLTGHASAANSQSDRASPTSSRMHRARSSSCARKCPALAAGARFACAQ